MRFSMFIGAVSAIGIALGAAWPNATAQELTADEITPSARAAMASAEQATNQSRVIPAELETALKERAAVEAAQPSSVAATSGPAGGAPLMSAMRGN